MPPIRAIGRRRCGVVGTQDPLGHSRDCLAGPPAQTRGVAVQGNGLRSVPAPWGAEPAIDLTSKRKQLALLVVAVTLLVVIFVGLVAAPR